MSQVTKQQEAHDRARRDAVAQALQEEIPPLLENVDFLLRPRSLTMNNQAEPSNRPRRATVEDGNDDAEASSHSREGEPVELSGAMLTPPLTPHSPYARNERVMDAHDSENIIQMLRSQLEGEERRVAELEQDLRHAKTQVEQYTADRNSVQPLQDQAVMNYDENEITRLERRAERLRRLWYESREDVSRLQEELARKDRLIDGLRGEIRSRVEELQETNVLVSNRPQAEGVRSEVEARREDSRMLLRRSNDGIGIIRAARVYNVPRGIGFVCH